MGLSPWPAGSVLVRVVRFRAELSCGTPSWCQGIRELAGVGKHLRDGDLDVAEVLNKLALDPALPVNVLLHVSITQAPSTGFLLHAATAILPSTLSSYQGAAPTSPSSTPAGSTTVAVPL